MKIYILSSVFLGFVIIEILREHLAKVSQKYHLYLGEAYRVNHTPKSSLRPSASVQLFVVEIAGITITVHKDRSYKSPLRNAYNTFPETFLIVRLIFSSSLRLFASW
jgi:hypothetical protein